MAKATIDQDACKGCGLCVLACPKKIIELSKHQINTKGYHPAEVTDQEKCIGCAACGIMCPDSVIIVER
ncbi:MAG: 4Fe-4S dicluster domain-containing protein [Christensenellales bacterium]|jgi:2-oxoglutarate ferredoxin oxidoreductase subunit delta